MQMSNDYRELVSDEIIQENDIMEWENMGVSIIAPSHYIGNPVNKLPLQRDSWIADATYHPRRCWRKI